MKSRPPISTWILVFTFVHLTASIGCALLVFVDDLTSVLNVWVFQVLVWSMSVLALPILLPLHTSEMSRGTTAMLLVANSVVAGLIFGLVVFAIRRRASDATTISADTQRGSP